MKHLTLSDRIRIESMLEMDCSLSVIARELNRSPSTISRELRKHRCLIPHYSSPSGRKRSECEHAESCKVQFLCGNSHCSSFCSKCRSKRCTLYCSLFSPRKCERLKQPPYVCNHCPKLRSCSHDFYFYRAKYADDTYHNIKTLSRSGINQTPESLEQMDKLVSPLLKQGQPLSHIYFSHSAEIPCLQRTLYNYIDQNLFTAINLDLPRKVRNKPRKQHHEECEIPGYRENRTYTDNDSAFKDTGIFERENGQGMCTRIFYCDPMTSWQKGQLEKNHEFIRYILPKGCSFSGLTQKTVTQIANHINSTARASLNGHTPFELAQLLLDKKLIQICHMAQIPADQVILKPSLIK